MVVTVRHRLETSGQGDAHDLTPAVTADPGEEVVLQTRNAFDGEVKPSSRAGDLNNLNLNVVHPLTGPVFVN